MNTTPRYTAQAVQSLSTGKVTYDIFDSLIGTAALPEVRGMRVPRLIASKAQAEMIAQALNSMSPEAPKTCMRCGDRVDGLAFPHTCRGR